MKIAITWDYELYFGKQSGSVAKCMLEPTDLLLNLAAKYQIPLTFFPDVGGLMKFEQQAELANDLNLVKAQISHWDASGHETGLHIHPHWEKSQWNGSSWEHDLSYYKLADFSIQDAQMIIEKYANYISSLLQKPVKSFRAGGWCVQPFDSYSSVMQKIGIEVDSSVFKGGKNLTHPYNYDFSNAPSLPYWKFSKDILSPDPNGNFTELPISSMVYPPLFFWKLFVLGRLFPTHHKPIGNGFPAKGGASKKELLTRSHMLCVSADGYFASQLKSALQCKQDSNESILVVIGHPKALTKFGLKKLESFIAEHCQIHEFVTLSSLRC